MRENYDWIENEMQENKDAQNIVVCAAKCVAWKKKKRTGKSVGWAEIVAGLEKVVHVPKKTTGFDIMRGEFWISKPFRN